MKIARTLPFYSSLIKMATSKRLFKEVLKLYRAVQEDQVVIDSRAIWSCLLFAASEDKSDAELCAHFFDELRKCTDADGPPTAKDYYGSKIIIDE